MTPAGFELYNLRQDASETTDLAAREPEKLRELTEQLTSLFHEIQRETACLAALQRPRLRAKADRLARLRRQTITDSEYGRKVRSW